MIFKPKCLTGEIQTAFNNRGYLLPCCYCDHKEHLETSQFKKLLKASKVSEVDSIEEIIFSDEWREFEKNLRTEKNIPKVCIEHCKDRGDDNIKRETFTNPKGKVTGKYIV
mgnify:FL=1|jgi:hypothetical protein